MQSQVFGPVPSRRLGRSLGIDLVPFKTCTYDCIYCQLGPTTCKTLQRKEWVPLEDVLAELEPKLSSQPDYITLSGSGEPTLFSRAGELIRRIKAMTSIPVAVLTNGSLLFDKGVRAELLDADLVVPSLDAGNESTFRLVNRPHEDVSFDRMLEGLIAFRGEFRGHYWLEVLLLDGYTTADDELAALAGCVERIRPDRVQLNTVTRPAAEEFAVGVSRRRLLELAGAFDPPAEVIADFRKVSRQAKSAAGRQEVLDMLRRRPCSVQDLADGLGMHRNEVLKYVAQLSAENRLESTSTPRGRYYRAVP